MLPFLLPAIAAGVGAIGSFLGTKATNKANAVEGQKNRDFNETSATQAFEREKELRGTAYQDTMADMRAAGLNPMMAAQQGATSTPSAPQASAGGMPTMQNAISPAIQSAMAGARMFADLDNTNNDTALKGAQATQAIAAAHREATTAEQTQKQSKVLDSVIESAPEEAKARIYKAKADQDYGRTERIINMINQGTGAVSNATSAAGDLMGGFAKQGMNQILKEANQLKGLKGWKVP